jgi:hypothetical protein
MAVSAEFGPNTPAVRAFLESLREVPWFSQVGQPTEHDAELTRVAFDFVAQHHAAPYAAWGAALVGAESRIDRLVFDSRRLGEWDAIRKVVEFPRQWVDDFYLALSERYPGYYGETCLYPHELVDPPIRLLWGAVDEIMVADLDPTLRFFGSLVPWLCFHRIDYLLSWNYAHVVNPVAQRQLETACHKHGLRAPLLVSPESIPKASSGQTVRRRNS